MGFNHFTARRRTYLASLAVVALTASAQATPMPGSGVGGSNSAHFGTSGAVMDAAITGTPLTHFLPNGTGGFDAFIYPELLDGTPSLQGGIFTLPSTVNAGYVVILDLGGSLSNQATWSDVLVFIDNGNGHATTLQMLDGGPSQASYFPSVSKVQNHPHATIAEALAVDFTDYTVTSGSEVRNYHFFTGTLGVPDGGSTLILLGSTFTALVVYRRKLQAA